MALITCPHCGKNVSDSLETCIHCGGSLRDKPVPEKEREYAALSTEEQENLRKEYDSKFPEFSKIEKKAKKFDISACVAGSIFLLGVVFMAIFVAIDLEIIGIIVGCIGILASVWLFFMLFYSGSLHKKHLTCLKRFQKWLEQEKKVHYSVILDEKDRKIFDQINID